MKIKNLPQNSNSVLLERFIDKGWMPVYNKNSNTYKMEYIYQDKKTKKNYRFISWFDNSTTLELEILKNRIIKKDHRF